MVVGVSVLLFPGSGISWCIFPSFSLKANDICFFRGNLIQLDLHICFDWVAKKHQLVMILSTYRILLTYIAYKSIRSNFYETLAYNRQKFCCVLFGDALLLDSSVFCLDLDS